MQRNPTRVGGAGQNNDVDVDDRRNGVVMKSYAIQGELMLSLLRSRGSHAVCEQIVDFICQLRRGVRERGGDYD